MHVTNLLHLGLEKDTSQGIQRIPRSMHLIEKGRPILIAKVGICTDRAQHKVGHEPCFGQVDFGGNVVNVPAQIEAGIQQVCNPYWSEARVKNERGDSTSAT